MLGTMVVVNVVAGEEGAIVDVHCIVGSRVVAEEPKAEIDISMRL